MEEGRRKKNGLRETFLCEVDRYNLLVSYANGRTARWGVDNKVLQPVEIFQLSRSSWMNDGEMYLEVIKFYKSKDPGVSLAVFQK